jgi:hypothetical protein
METMKSEYIKPHIRQISALGLQNIVQAQSFLLTQENEDVGISCVVGTDKPIDGYEFDVNSIGNSITIEVAPTSNLDLSFAVLDPAFNLLDCVNSAGLGGTETFVFTPSSTGQYDIEVNVSVPNAGGTYNLTISSENNISNLQLIGDDFCQNPAC